MQMTRADTLRPMQEHCVRNPQVNAGDSLRKLSAEPMWKTVWETLRPTQDTLCRNPRANTGHCAPKPYADARDCGFWL
jgi:hypothetical protein